MELNTSALLDDDVPNENVVYSPMSWNRRPTDAKSPVSKQSTQELHTT